MVIGYLDDREAEMRRRGDVPGDAGGTATCARSTGLRDRTSVGGPGAGGRDASQGDRAPAVPRFTRRVRPRARGCAQQGTASASRPRRAVTRPTNGTTASRAVATTAFSNASAGPGRLPYHGVRPPAAVRGRKTCKDGEKSRRPSAALRSAGHLRYPPSTRAPHKRLVDGKHASTTSMLRPEPLPVDYATSALYAFTCSMAQIASILARAAFRAGSTARVRPARR
jgi:hypothetical protein